jgi:hypothetical protein
MRHFPIPLMRHGGGRRLQRRWKGWRGCPVPPTLEQRAPTAGPSEGPDDSSPPCPARCRSCGPHPFSARPLPQDKRTAPRALTVHRRALGGAHFTARTGRGPAYRGTAHGREGASCAEPRGRARALPPSPPASAGHRRGRLQAVEWNSGGHQMRAARGAPVARGAACGHRGVRARGVRGKGRSCRQGVRAAGARAPLAPAWGRPDGIRAGPRRPALGEAPGRVGPAKRCCAKHRARWNKNARAARGGEPGCPEAREAEPGKSCGGRRARAARPPAAGGEGPAAAAAAARARAGALRCR